MRTGYSGFGRLRKLRTAGSVLGLAVALGASGCSSIERLPAVTVAQEAQASVGEIRDARVYVRETERIAAIAQQAYLRRAKTKAASAPRYFLALSGGGDDGAFGAGLLVGWSARGNRPSFDVVTGVSTGALSAPFAYLGREYDPQLQQVYSDASPDAVYRPRSVFAAVTEDAMADSAPLRSMIARNVSDAMVRRIAEEYGKGRLLLILTTNLDQGRPVVWNVGAIAASGSPLARDLIIDVLLASASMPAIFPPVMMNVTVDGQKYQEMHVDGGTVAQAFLYPPSFSARQAAARLGVSAAKLRASQRRIAYIIRNGRLARPEETVERQTVAIAKQAISTMIASSGVNDTYRMYLITRRDGVDFNLASIGDDFTVPYKGPFDRGYMNALFAYGYERGRAGYPWQKTPPGYAR
jgi:predicted acylesterase/phospholipase RssA